LAKELVRPKARPFSDVENSTTGDPKVMGCMAKKKGHLFGITRSCRQLTVKANLTKLTTIAVQLPKWSVGFQIAFLVAAA
jgi:hypothetical protein